MSQFFVAPLKLHWRPCEDGSYHQCPALTLSSNTHRSTSKFSASLGPTRRQILYLATLALTSSLFRTFPANAYSSRRSTESSWLPPLLYQEQTKRVVKTPSGLRYFDITEGTGETVRNGDTVSIHYVSRLGGRYGIKLDSSYDHASNGVVPSFVFVVGDESVVPGVNEMVKGMKVGGKRRGVLEPRIGYANERMKPVPQDFFAKRRLLSVLYSYRDATVIFDIALLKIKR